MNPAGFVTIDRPADVVVTDDDTQVLALSVGTLRELADAAPSVESRWHDNVSTQLAAQMPPT